jgi:hypothetical protein
MHEEVLRQIVLEVQKRQLFFITLVKLGTKSGRYNQHREPRSNSFEQNEIASHATTKVCLPCKEIPGGAADPHLVCEAAGGL